MKMVSVLESLENFQQPVVYLGGVVSAGGWEGDGLPELVKKPVGTIITSAGTGTSLYQRDRMLIDGARWRRKALWESDIVSFWIPAKPIDKAERELIDMGTQLGRYMVGAGPLRLIIGVDKNNTSRRLITESLTSFNEIFNPGWKLSVSDTLEDHVGELSQRIDQYTTG